MNITSPQRDLGVSVSNETHFSSQRDKTLKCECHLQSKGGTRNRAICRYSFVRYERYSLTATITKQPLTESEAIDRMNKHRKLTKQELAKEGIVLLSNTVVSHNKEYRIVSECV